MPLPHARSRVPELVLGAILAMTAPAIAAPKVIVVTAPKPSHFIEETTVRLRAELVAAGFEVARETSAANATFDPEQGALEASAAIAAVRLVPSTGGGAVDLWVTDAITHKLVMRRASEATPSLLALRCVELLRASLVEIEIAPQAAPVPVEVVSLVRAPHKHAAAPRPRFELAGGVTVLLAARSASLQPAPMIEAGVTHRALRVAARWMGPSTGAGFVATSGTVTVTQQALVVEAAYTPSIGAFRAGPAIDVGGYHLSVHGAPDPGFKSTDASPLSFVVGAGLDTIVGLGQNLSVFLDGRALVSNPVLIVAGNGERLAAMGRPLWTATVGLRIEL